MRLFLVDYEITDADRAIADSLRARGDEVITAAATGRAHFSIGSEADRKVHRTLSRLTDTALLHSSRATALMLEKVAEMRPDAVHIRTLGGYYLNLPLLAHALTRFRMPVVAEIEASDLTSAPDALIRRPTYRERTLRKIFSGWEQLHVVASSREVTDNLILDGHPGYIVPDRADPALYAQIYSLLV